MSLGTYTFNCLVCGAFESYGERDRDFEACPQCGKAAARGFTICANLSVPLHMTAAAVSGDAQARQAVYLQSDRHKADMAKDERIVERNREFEHRTNTELPKLVDKALDEHYADPRTRAPGYDKMIIEKRSRGEVVA